MVKRSEVLQCSDGLRTKVSNIIRRHIDSMKLLLMQGRSNMTGTDLYKRTHSQSRSYLNHLVPSLGSVFYLCIYVCIPV